jgi:hypothetical protein
MVMNLLSRECVGADSCTWNLAYRGPTAGLKWDSVSGRELWGGSVPAQMAWERYKQQPYR